MKQIIVKTAVKTVIVLVVLLAIATAVLNFAFPQHMATFFERIGNYSLAVRYSSQRYNATGDINDLARTYQNSVLYGRSDYIIKYGEELISFEDFDALCEEKDSSLKQEAFGEYSVSYKLYVYGNLSKAYATSGNFEKALKVANDSNGNSTFSSGNVYITLVIFAAETENVEFAYKIEEKLLLIRENLTEGSEDISTLNDMLEILKEVGQVPEEEQPISEE